MVVVITPAQPHGNFGPGLPFNLSVTPAPINPGHWGIVVETTPLPGLVTWIEDFPFVSTTPQFVLGLGTSRSLTASAQPALSKTEDQIHVTAEIFDQSGTITDTGQGTFPWEAEAGLAQLQLQIPTTGQGGFTDSDRALLQQTQVSTFTDQLLDNLTLAEITSGPQGGTASSVIRNWVWGILVRIRTIPPELISVTPDQNYWFASLAVCTVFRGSDLWIRVPVHTSSKIIGFGAEGVVAAVTALTETQWLLDMSVQVAFRAGVTGQAYLMALP